MRQAPLVLLAAVLAIALAGAAPTAQARSVYDPDIGWSTAQRRALHLARVDAKPCTRDISRRDIHLQSIIEEHRPIEAIRAAFHYRWGNAWYDFCHGGRLSIGVHPGGAADLPKARAIVARRHLTKYIRFVAVRSTYRELSDEVDLIGRLYDAQALACQLTWGIDTERNTVVVDLATTLSDADRAAVRAHALAAPVNVVVHDDHADNLCAELL
jgi:hypothetical protein